MLADEGHILISPLHLCLWTDKGFDSLRIVLGTDNKHLIPLVNDSVTIWDGHMTILQNTTYHKITSQKLLHLHQCTT